MSVKIDYHMFRQNEQNEVYRWTGGQKKDEGKTCPTIKFDKCHLGKLIYNFIIIIYLCKDKVD